MVGFTQWSYEKTGMQKYTDLRQLYSW